ncbi:MAG TPA: serine/threonine-protein kinase, partial [Myxococcota bacterium]
MTTTTTTTTATRIDGAIGTARLSDYVTDVPLGTGGMATVLRAVHTPSGTVVALKKMPPHVADDEVYVARFVRELDVGARLRHPHIVEVHGWGRHDDGTWFLALELCDGGTLVQLLKQAPKLPAPITVLILDALLSALQEAHAHGVIHRDIKPPNILLLRDGTVKLSDFGIARSASDQTLTATGEVIGTPAYMSPEQALGQRDIDGRSDLFAVGMLAYRLLVGFNPFASDNVATSILRVTTGPSLHVGEALPTVPLVLERTIDGLVEKDRDKRLPSAQAARERLAPLVKATRERYPDLLARLLRDPAGTVDAIRRAAAADEVKVARALVLEAPARAMVHAARAHAHDPDDVDAQTLLDHLATQHGFRLDVAGDARVAAAEAELETRPEDPAVIRKLANLHRGLNNPVEAARYLKRYLLLRPDDAAARLQLGELLGNDDVAAFTRSLSAAPKLSTQQIMQGVRTGGIRSAASSSAASSAASSSPARAMSTAVRAPAFGGPTVLANDGPRDGDAGGRLKLAVGVGAVVVVVGLGAVIATAVDKGERGLDNTLRGVESAQATVLDGFVDGAQQPFVERAHGAARIKDWQGVVDAANFGLSADPEHKGQHTPTLLRARAEAFAALDEPKQALADLRLA